MSSHRCARGDPSGEYDERARGGCWRSGARSTSSPAALAAPMLERRSIAPMCGAADYRRQCVERIVAASAARCDNQAPMARARGRTSRFAAFVTFVAIVLTVIVVAAEVAGGDIPGDSPFGYLDRADLAVGSQSVLVQGWVIDAQSLSDRDTCLRQRWVAVGAVADRSRADVGAVYRRSEIARIFGVAGDGRGRQRVCASTASMSVWVRTTSSGVARDDGDSPFGALTCRRRPRLAVGNGARLGHRSADGGCDTGLHV